MKIPSAVLAALLFVATPGFAEIGSAAVDDAQVGEAESVMTMRVQGEIGFDTSGKVVHHQITTPIDAPIRAIVETVVEKWRFHPYLKDGVAVNVKTPFELTLVGRAQADGNYAITAETARFGVSRYDCKDENSDSCKQANPIVHTPRKPAYPPALARAGVGGQVMVYLYINPDGTIADAKVAQTALFGVKGNPQELEKARRSLEVECLAYAKRIQVTPGSGDLVGGGDTHRVAGLPFRFNANGAFNDNLGEWRLEARGRKRVADWMKDFENVPGASDAAGGGLLSMRSEYRLMTPPPQG